MTIVLAFLKKAISNRYVQLVLVAILLAGGGYAFGRYGQPAKIIEKEKIVEKIVYQDKIVEKIVKVMVQDKNRHTETTTTKSPDGTTVTKIITDTKTDTKTDTSDNKTEEKVVYKDRIVEKEKIVEASKPGWRVGAGIGLSIPSTFLGEPQIGVPGLRGAVVEIGVDRRVIGPLWVGLHGNTQGTVTLGLSGEF